MRPFILYTCRSAGLAAWDGRACDGRRRPRGLRRGANLRRSRASAATADATAIARNTAASCARRRKSRSTCGW